jgi:hypothetical protein
VLTGLTGCSNPCESRTRCTGERQYEWCNTGSDFAVHRVTVECPEPNPACIQENERYSRCVHAPATRCDAAFADRCEGTLRIYCDERFGWVQAVDCTKLGSPGCHVDASHGKAVCD